MPHYHGQCDRLAADWGTNSVTPDEIVSRLQSVAATAQARLDVLRQRTGEAGRRGMVGARRLWRRTQRAARDGWDSIRSPGAAGWVPGDPLDPSGDEALLPGTSDRAFRIGLVVVS